MRGGAPIAKNYRMEGCCPGGGFQWRLFCQCSPGPLDAVLCRDRLHLASPSPAPFRELIRCNFGLEIATGQSIALKMLRIGSRGVLRAGKVSGGTRGDLLGRDRLLGSIQVPTCVNHGARFLHATTSITIRPCTCIITWVYPR